MSLLQKLKSALGLGPSGSSSGNGDTATQDVDVTVEREPSTATEDAVKGTDAGGAADEPDVTEAQTDTAADEGAAVEQGAAADSVQEIKGIGPTYAERLGEAGISTVGDLRDADADALAEETGIAVSRLSDWIERADEY